MWLLSTNMKIISKIKRGIGEEVSKTTIIYSLIGKKRPQQKQHTWAEKPGRVLGVQVGAAPWVGLE